MAVSHANSELRRFPRSHITEKLRVIAGSAKVATQATGVAIAVGDSRGMQCRASLGTAPALGVSLRPETGLSGYCLRSGEVVRCSDTRSDPRVDAAAAQQLDARAILIIPVLTAGEITGLLEVFWPQPNAFDEGQVKRLQPLADFIGAAIAEDRLQRLDPTQEETPREATGFLEPWTVPTAERETATPATVRKTVAGNVAAMFRSLPRISMPDVLRPHVFAVKAGLVCVALACILAVTRHVVQRHTYRPGTGQQTVAVAPPPLIGFAPADIAQRVGTTFAVDVTLNRAQNVCSVPLQVSYDPKMLRLVSVAAGDLLGKDGQAVALVHRVLAPGTLHMTASRPFSIPGISGDGTVFTLIFLAQAPGQSSLKVDQAELRNPSMQTIMANGSQATVTIRKE